VVVVWFLAGRHAPVASTISDVSHHGVADAHELARPGPRLGNSDPSASKRGLLGDPGSDSDTADGHVTSSDDRLRLDQGSRSSENRVADVPSVRDRVVGLAGKVWSDCSCQVRGSNSLRSKQAPDVRDGSMPVKRWVRALRDEVG
jgi:hypothetical protein